MRFFVSIQFQQQHEHDLQRLTALNEEGIGDVSATRASVAKRWLSPFLAELIGKAMLSLIVGDCIAGDGSAKASVVNCFVGWHGIGVMDSGRLCCDVFWCL